MALMENLTDENVDMAEDFFKKKIASVNEEALFSRFKIPDVKSKKEVKQEHQLVLRVNLLENQVKSLESYIKSVFDGHILINGEFKKINI